MDQKQNAIEILVQVAHRAQSKGVLTLEEAVTVSQAINILKEDAEKTAEGVEVVAGEVK